MIYTLWRPLPPSCGFQRQVSLLWNHLFPDAVHGLPADRSPLFSLSFFHGYRSTAPHACGCHRLSKENFRADYVTRIWKESQEAQRNIGGPKLQSALTIGPGNRDEHLLVHKWLGARRGASMHPSLRSRAPLAHLPARKTGSGANKVKIAQGSGAASGDRGGTTPPTSLPNS